MEENKNYEEETFEVDTYEDEVDDYDYDYDDYDDYESSDGNGVGKVIGGIVIGTGLTLLGVGIKKLWDKNKAKVADKTTAKRIAKLEKTGKYRVELIEDEDYEDEVEEVEAEVVEETKPEQKPNKKK